MPVITLEVLSDSYTEYVQSNAETQSNYNIDASQDPSAGLHFLTEEAEDTTQSDERDESKEAPAPRTSLLEYLLRHDGSVVCKLCGEILQSRTHWYRHKYKLHVMQPLNPTPLYQCEQCLAFFKSRKGYIGHLASKHSETLSDATPVLTQAEACIQITQAPPEEIEQTDAEMSIPTTSVPNYQATTQAKVAEVKKSPKGLKIQAPETNRAEWEETRSREEKLVSDIIDRVRRECEAQGTTGTAAAARRGYSRRYTVMHT